MWERVPQPAQILLEAADHDGLQILRLDFDPAREALRVEYFQEGREGVLVTVVRRRRKEQPVLEAMGQFTHGARHLAVGGVADASRGSRMMGLVEDQKRARPKLAEDVAKSADVGLLGHHGLRNDEARANRPRVCREAARSTRREKVLSVNDCKVEAEFLRELVLPLQQHRRWGRDNDQIDAPPEQKLAHHQSGLYYLAEADIIRDQEVHTWKRKSLPQRKQLVGIEPDPGTEWSLEQTSVRGGRGLPLGRSKMSAKGERIVWRDFRESVPRVDFGPSVGNLRIEDSVERIALRIVIHAHERMADRRTISGIVNGLDQPVASAKRNEGADRVRHVFSLLR